LLNKATSCKENELAKENIYKKIKTEEKTKLCTKLLMADLEPMTSSAIPLLWEDGVAAEL